MFIGGDETDLFLFEGLEDIDISFPGAVNQRIEIYLPSVGRGEPIEIIFRLFLILREHAQDISQFVHPPLYLTYYLFVDTLCQGRAVSFVFIADLDDTLLFLAAEP